MDLQNSFRLLAGRTRWLKKRLPPLTGAVYLPLSGGRKVYVDARDVRGPSFNIMYGGPKAFVLYEKIEKDAILAHLPDTGVFLDIGANIGLFSLYAHWQKPGARIHAFEPHPVNHACLKQTCSANRIESIQAHALAIGDHEGEIQLYFDESDSGGHSTDQSALESNRAPTQSVRVPLTTLDQFVRKHSLPCVDVIKIDIQGGEASAIRGAHETIRRFKPTLLIECDYRSAGELIEALQSTEVDYEARPLSDSPQSAPALNLSELKARIQADHEQGILQRNYLLTVPG